MIRHNGELDASMFLIHYVYGWSSPTPARRFRPTFRERFQPNRLAGVCGSMAFGTSEWYLIRNELRYKNVRAR